MIVLCKLNISDIPCMFVNMTTTLNYKSCIVSTNLSPSHCLRALWEMDRLLSKMDANAQETMRPMRSWTLKFLFWLTPKTCMKSDLVKGQIKKLQELKMSPLLDSGASAGSSWQPHEYVAINSVSMYTIKESDCVILYMLSHTHTHYIYIYIYIYISYLWCHPFDVVGSIYRI